MLACQPGRPTTSCTIAREGQGLARTTQIPRLPEVVRLLEMVIPEPHVRSGRPNRKSACVGIDLRTHDLTRPGPHHPDRQKCELDASGRADDAPSGTPPRHRNADRPGMAPPGGFLRRPARGPAAPCSRRTLPFSACSTSPPHRRSVCGDPIHAIVGPAADPQVQSQHHPPGTPLQSMSSPTIAECVTHRPRVQVAIVAGASPARPAHRVTPAQSLGITGTSRSQRSSSSLVVSIAIIKACLAATALRNTFRSPPTPLLQPRGGTRCPRQSLGLSIVARSAGDAPVLLELLHNRRRRPRIRSRSTRVALRQDLIITRRAGSASPPSTPVQSKVTLESGQINECATPPPSADRSFTCQADRPPVRKPRAWRVALPVGLAYRLLDQPSKLWERWSGPASSTDQVRWLPSDRTDQRPTERPNGAPADAPAHYRTPKQPDLELAGLDICSMSAR